MRQWIYFAESALALRRRDRLLEVSQALSSLPVADSIIAIGRYYQGLAVNPRGQGNRQLARQCFEYAASFAPPAYQARSVLALGAIAANERDTQSELWLYGEAITQARSAQDLYTAIHASKMLAVRRAVDGDHQQAIEDLESLWPMVRLIAKRNPATYNDWLNSLAVELSEVGRLEDASRAIQIVQASPLLAFNPEWQQTAQEIAEAQAQPLIIAVPEMTPLGVKRRAVAVVAVMVFLPREKVSRPCHKKVTRQLSHVTRNRAGPLGPRAPPVFT